MQQAHIGLDLKALKPSRNKSQLRTAMRGLSSSNYSYDVHCVVATVAKELAVKRAGNRWNSRRPDIDGGFACSLQPRTWRHPVCGHVEVAMSSRWVTSAVPWIYLANFKASIRLKSIQISLNHEASNINQEFSITTRSYIPPCCSLMCARMDSSLSFRSGPWKHRHIRCDANCGISGRLSGGLKARSSKAQAHSPKVIWIAKEGLRDM